ncbi:MAG TPA: class I SAM-dependent methyltransferase [Planctomycetes bacterium]|nr:class I SAM-dependent methyltransferase [Fuerstiella sp.]HIK91364.1 class I SAM-dependent methyltransferase [Planctomycetota bacterium]
MSLERTLEPEVMDTVEEAVDYDSMNHSTVNRVFVQDLLRFAATTNSDVSVCGDTEAVTVDLSDMDTSLNGGVLPVGAVIDVGAGTALIPLDLIHAAPHVGPIIAVDLSVEMLRLAVRHLRERKVTGRILPLLTDAKRLPFADSSCAAVISNSIVHHIPEPISVFHELRRGIKPDGLLFVRDLMRPESPDVVEQIVAQYAGDDNAHQQQLFRQSLHAALSVDEVRELLDRADFANASVTATSDRHWTVAARMPKP